MSAPSGAALTTAGYTQAPTGVYTQAFGTISIQFNIVDEPDSGTLIITPATDDNSTDIANALANLSSLGYNFSPDDIGSAGGTVSVSLSL